IVFLFMLLMIATDIVQKYKTRFWIEDGKFIYKTGVFVLKEKELTINRIQSIDITEPLFLRIFGVCKLDIQTPAEGVSIEGIKLSQAEEIRRSVYKEKVSEEEESKIVSDGDIDTEILDENIEPVETTENVSEDEMTLIHK